jgi:protein tyrosine phosphatase (PTP) superfamily phosphohydrolase (DUF442 family)
VALGGILQRTVNIRLPCLTAARCACLAAATLACAGAIAQPAALHAPNVVEISPHLVTSGQPNAAALAGLAAQGFEAVIYLAPPTVSDAVRDEALIVARQGLVFVNIPMPFDNPTERHFEDFAAVLQGLAGRKVLVHCQVNMRASSMVFLYRAVVARDDPRSAWESVSRVWLPEGAWRRLVLQVLQKHRIAFEPL